MMRNVVVTGGSRGIGLAIARKLAASGYCVIAVARKRTDELDAAIARAAQADGAETGKGGGAIQFAPFDLGNIDGIQRFVAGLRKSHGPIYGLVNNAAVGAAGTLALMSNAKLAELVHINTLAPMVLTKYVVRGMMADGGGRIVNVASIVAFTGYSGLAVYSATKASIVGFTRALAREVGRMGVNVNAVAPGFLETDMTAGMTDEHRAKVARRSALPRPPTVEDVSDAVAFLMGDGAGSITGTVLTVDAGSTA
jgi:3-oxoacyl-[acyl-carrier protein] reductase